MPRDGGIPTKLLLPLALLALAPLAAADTTCVGSACVTDSSGTYGSGSCAEPDGYAGQYSDHRVDVGLGNGYSASAWTYNGCAASDDGTTSSSWSWLYANAAVIGAGQLLVYANAGWSGDEHQGPDGSGGACIVYYFAYDAITGSGGYARPCNVLDVYPQPPVLV